MYRRYGRRFKRRRKLPYRAKSSSVGQKAYSLARRSYYTARKALGKIGNVEYKTANGLGSAVNVTNVLTFTNLHSIAQGDGDGQRIGDKIMLKKLHMRWNINMDDGENSNVIRLMVFRWNENTIPLASDILTSTSTVRSFLNVQESAHFHMIWDKIITLDKFNKLSQSGSFNKTLNTEAVYDGAASSDHSDGQIFIGYMAEYVTIAPVLNYSSRIRYIDH